MLLDRVAAFIMLGTIAVMRGNESGPEMLALARQACEVPAEIDDAPLFKVILQLLDAFDAATIATPDDRRRMGYLILATTVARTPDVPVPATD